MLSKYTHNSTKKASDRPSEFSQIQPFLPLIRPILDYKQKTPHK